MTSDTPNGIFARIAGLGVPAPLDRAGAVGGRAGGGHRRIAGGLGTTTATTSRCPGPIRSARPTCSPSTARAGRRHRGDRLRGPAGCAQPIRAWRHARQGAGAAARRGGAQPVPGRRRGLAGRHDRLRHRDAHRHGGGRPRRRRPPDHRHRAGAEADGLRVELGGDAVRDAEEGEGGAAEGAGIMAALVILVLLFGSLLAAACRSSPRCSRSAPRSG